MAAVKMVGRLTSILILLQGSISLEVEQQQSTFLRRAEEAVTTDSNNNDYNKRAAPLPGRGSDTEPSSSPSPSPTSSNTTTSTSDSPTSSTTTPTSSPSSTTAHPTSAPSASIASPTTPGSAVSGDIDYADYIHTHGVSPEHNESPACPLQRHMDDDDIICPAVEGWLTLTETIPPALGAGASAKLPYDPKNSLPQDMKDLRPLPLAVSQDHIRYEKPTYYWFYRLITNLYSAVGEVTKGKINYDEVKVPNGWKAVNSYSLVDTRREGDDVDGPLAVSYVKEDHMIVLIRGTVFSSEWVHDFAYGFAPVEETQPLFPGRVHQGFLKVFKMIADQLVQKDVKDNKPKYVTLAGHSLGGAVCNLLAYNIADTNPDIQVSMISYGAPNVGDKDFVDGFNKKVNNRHLTFTGTGDLEDADSYLVGDFISQVPCGKIKACPGLPGMENSSSVNSFAYAAVGGVVPFTADDMDNSEVWRYRSNLSAYRFSPIACHVCSYLCFTAPSVGDPEDRCVFTLEWNMEVSFDYRCPINM